MRKWLWTVALAAIALPVHSQVSAEHVTPPAPAPPVAVTEVESPMKLTVALGPDEKHPASVLALEVNHSRRFSQTAKFVVDKLTVREVRVGKRLGRGKNEELIVTLFMETEWFRQKAHIGLSLAGAGGQVWTWSDRVVLGMKAGDVVGRGALGAMNASKAQKVEVVVPLTEELKSKLGTDPRLEITVTIV